MYQVPFPGYKSIENLLLYPRQDINPEKVVRDGIYAANIPINVFEVARPSTKDFRNQNGDRIRDCASITHISWRFHTSLGFIVRVIERLPSPVFFMKKDDSVSRYAKWEGHLTLERNKENQRLEYSSIDNMLPTAEVCKKTLFDIPECSGTIVTIHLKYKIDAMLNIESGLVNLCARVINVKVFNDKKEPFIIGMGTIDGYALDIEPANASGAVVTRSVPTSDNEGNFLMEWSVCVHYRKRFHDEAGTHYMPENDDYEFYADYQLDMSYAESRAAAYKEIMTPDGQWLIVKKDHHDELHVHVRDVDYFYLRQIGMVTEEQKVIVE